MNLNVGKAHLTENDGVPKSTEVILLFYSNKSP